MKQNEFFFVENNPQLINNQIAFRMKPNIFLKCYFIDKNFYKNKKSIFFKRRNKQLKLTRFIKKNL
jgi:hypothetical protein